MAECPPDLLGITFKAALVERVDDDVGAELLPDLVAGEDHGWFPGKERTGPGAIGIRKTGHTRGR